MLKYCGRSCSIVLQSHLTAGESVPMLLSLWQGGCYSNGHFFIVCCHCGSPCLPSTIIFPGCFPPEGSCVLVCLCLFLLLCPLHGSMSLLYNALRVKIHLIKQRHDRLQKGWENIQVPVDSLMSCSSCELVSGVHCTHFKESDHMSTLNH